MKNALTCALLLILLQSSAQEKNLDYYVSNGLRNSPVLKDFQYKEQANAIDSLRLKAGYGPQINATTAGLYAPITNGWGYDEVITNHHTYSALLSVSQALSGKNNINNQYLAIHLQNLHLRNQGKITEQELKRSIIQQYITVYGDQQQIDFNTELMTLLREEEEVLKKLGEKGIYKQTDFLSFLVTVEQQQLTIQQLRLQYQNDFATLNYISGITDTAFTVLARPNIELSDAPALQQTVFYQQYQLDSLVIKNNDRQIDYNYKPKVNLVADAGYNSSFAVTPYRNLGASAGISLTVPIYDGKQKKMQHRKNEIAEQGRSTYRDFFVQQYGQQIAQLMQQIQWSDQLITLTAKQINYADGLIKAQRKQLVTGDVRIADYIIAIGNYLNAKNIITQQTISKMQLINQLNYWNRKQ